MRELIRLIFEGSVVFVELIVNVRFICRILWIFVRIVVFIGSEMGGYCRIVSGVGNLLFNFYVNRIILVVRCDENRVFRDKGRTGRCVRIL